MPLPFVLPTEADPVAVVEGDCLAGMATLPDSSVDLILTDPPYFQFKDEAWDNQWATPAAFLAWLGAVRDEWHRVLKPNGSLYCFMSPQMAARVECLIAEKFNVLNSITWVKHDGYGNGLWSRQCKEELRSYFPQTERIIFAEHYGSDNSAKGAAGYAAKCDELRGFVFEPLRKYFDDERVRCGISNEQIMDGMAARGVGRYMFARHTFSRSQWCLPTEEQYTAARDLFNEHARSADMLAKDYKFLQKEYDFLKREYDFLKVEYDELRQQYEELRRPFTVASETPYTDVWNFKTVPARKGKHPCEKPAEMIRYIIEVSSKPGALVLDSFAGSGVVGDVCVRTGRRAVLMESDPKYAAAIRDRIGNLNGDGPQSLFREALYTQPSLFTDAT